jgi:hypothetical protein
MPVKHLVNAYATTPAPSSYVGYTALFRLEPLDLSFSGTITITFDFPIGAEAPKVYMSVPGDPTRFEEVRSTLVGGKLQVKVSRLGVFFVGRSLVDGGASDAAYRTQPWTRPFWTLDTPTRAQRSQTRRSAHVFRKPAATS